MRVSSASGTQLGKRHACRRDGHSGPTDCQGLSCPQAHQDAIAAPASYMLWRPPTLPAAALRAAEAPGRGPGFGSRGMAGRVMMSGPGAGKGMSGVPGRRGTSGLNQQSGLGSHLLEQYWLAGGDRVKDAAARGDRRSGGGPAACGGGKHRDPGPRADFTSHGPEVRPGAAAGKLPVSVPVVPGGQARPGATYRSTTTGP